MRKTVFSGMFIMVSINIFAQSGPDTTGYIKTTDGSEYKIFHTPKGQKVAAGNFMELNIKALYKDSILFSSYEDAMPQFGLYDTANFPAPFKEVFKNIAVGDSVVLRIPTDSILAKTPGAAFMEKGYYVYQFYGISNTYKTKEQVDSVQKIYAPLAKEKAAKKQNAQLQKFLNDSKDDIAKDDQLIAAYLAKNNIKAVKTNWGSYIAVKKEGAGRAITATDVASVNYTGKPFGGGKTFDSNTDPAFKHVQPYEVNLNQMSSVILGWFDVLLHMKKGAIATVYIPSSLAYGKEGRMPDITPDAILVFDMAVTDVMTEQEMADKAAAAGKVMPVTPKPKAVVKKTVPATKPVSKPKPAAKKSGK